jgi:hypothetical protein
MDDQREIEHMLILNAHNAFAVRFVLNAHNAFAVRLFLTRHELGGFPTRRRFATCPTTHSKRQLRHPAKAQLAGHTDFVERLQVALQGCPANVA